MADQWYLARDKKKEGPYSLAQMKQMAAAGQLLPTDMVLQEGTQKWRRASEVEGLCPTQPPVAIRDQGSVESPLAIPALEILPADGPKKDNPQVQMNQMAGVEELLPTDMVLQEEESPWAPASQVPGLIPTAAIATPPPAKAVPVASEAAEWHYLQNSQQSGPVPWSQLQQLAASGQLCPTDLVWKNGMPAWATADSIQTLFPHLPAPPHPPAGLPEWHDEEIEIFPDDESDTPVASPRPVRQLTSRPSDLQAKWSKVYGRELELIELLIVELFHRLVPKDRSLYTFPNIPEHKLANAKATYAKIPRRSSQLLLGLVDNTSFGSAKVGYLLTSQRVYWHNTGPEHIGKKQYETIHLDEVVATASLTATKVMLTPTISLNAETIWKETAEGVANFIKQAAAFTIATRWPGIVAYTTALTTLSDAMSKGHLDLALPEEIRGLLSEVDTENPQDDFEIVE